MHFLDWLLLLIPITIVLTIGILTIGVRPYY